MFPITAWQELTTSSAKFIAERYSLAPSVISPFGFEVLDDPEQFLNRRLRRFFIYIGIAREISADLSYAIQVEYLARLYAACLGRFDDIFGCCRLLITDQGSVRIGRDRARRSDSSSCLPVEISSEIRRCDDILEEYAKYIVWTAFAIRSRSLPELRRVRWSRIARRRLLQLHLMHLAIFGQGEKIDTQDIMRYLSLPDGEIEKDQFQKLWKQRIQPENETMVQTASVRADVTLNGTGLHQTRGISFRCNGKIVAVALEQIKGTYRRFTPQETVSAGQIQPTLITNNRTPGEWR